MTWEIGLDDSVTQFILHQYLESLEGNNLSPLCLYYESCIYDVLRRQKSEPLLVILKTLFPI